MLIKAYAANALKAGEKVHVLLNEFRNNASALEAFTHFHERDYTAVETPGAIIRLIDTGAGEPAFIFLHYWGGSARTWAAVIQRLKDKARCIALNQRGWGGSVDAENVLATAGDKEQQALVSPWLGRTRLKNVSCSCARPRCRNATGPRLQSSAVFGRRYKYPASSAFSTALVRSLTRIFHRMLET